MELQDAFADIIVRAMGAGLSTFITRTLDILDSNITGITKPKFHLQKIGHGQAIDVVDALEAGK